MATQTRVELSSQEHAENNLAGTPLDEADELDEVQTAGGGGVGGDGGRLQERWDSSAAHITVIHGTYSMKWLAAQGIMSCGHVRPCLAQRQSVHDHA